MHEKKSNGLITCILGVVCFINYGNVVNLFTLHYHNIYEVPCQSVFQEHTLHHCFVLWYIYKLYKSALLWENVWRFYCCTKITCVSVSFSALDCSLFLL